MTWLAVTEKMSRKRTIEEVRVMTVMTDHDNDHDDELMYYIEIGLK